MYIIKTEEYIEIFIDYVYECACVCQIVLSIGELASCPTIGHDLRVVYRHIVIG